MIARMTKGEVELYRKIERAKRVVSALEVDVYRQKVELLASKGKLESSKREIDRLIKTIP